MSIDMLPPLLLMIGGICGCVPWMPALAFPICTALAGFVWLII